MSQLDAYQIRMFLCVICFIVALFWFFYLIMRLYSRVEKAEYRATKAEQHIGKIYEEIDEIKFKK